MRKFLLIVALLWVGFGVLVAWRNKPVVADDSLALEGYTLRFGSSCCGGRVGRVIRCRRCRWYPSTEERGLRWLARHQSRDGSWRPLELAACCTRTRCTGANGFVDDERATAVALLAFLGAGFTPSVRAQYVDEIDGRTRSFGKTVLAGASWLAERQDADGAVGPRDELALARHVLATFALVELYGFTSSMRFRVAAQKAIHHLEASRARDGGWGFTPGAPTSDAVVTRRALLALASARVSGLEVASPGEPPIRYDWRSLDDEESPPSWRELAPRQLTRLRGCAEGSFEGPQGRVYETAWAVIRLELGLKYEVPLRGR